MCKLHDTASCMIAALTNLHSETTLTDFPDSPFVLPDTLDHSASAPTNSFAYTCFGALVLLDSLPLVLLEHLPQEGLPLLCGSCGPLLETVPEGFDPSHHRPPLGGAQLLEMRRFALDKLVETALVLLGLLKSCTLELAPPATAFLWYLD